MTSNNDNRPHAKQTQQGRKTDRTNNTLTSAQKFRLYTWMVEQKETLERRRATFPEAAHMASDALKFLVTRHNVAQAVQSGIVSWARRSERGGQNAGPALVSLRARVARLENTLGRVCDNLGLPHDLDQPVQPQAESE